MPRQAPRTLPDGWQIARRGAGLYYLQQRVVLGDGEWADVAGPYKRYQSAYERMERERKQLQKWAEANLR